MIRIIFLWFIPILGFALTPTALLQKKLLAAQTLSADFHQVIHNEAGDTMQESWGKVAIRRPQQFRWEIQKPMAQLIISNGKTIWVSEPELQQVTIKPFEQSFSETPILLFTQKVPLDRYFVIKKLKTNRFQLVPKNQDALLEKMIVIFKGENIAALKLYNHLGQMTEIQFSSVKNNPNLANRLFTFTPPKDFDVIDQSRS